MMQSLIHVIPIKGTIDDLKETYLKEVYSTDDLPPECIIEGVVNRELEEFLECYIANQMDMNDPAYVNVLNAAMLFIQEAVDDINRFYPELKVGFLDFAGIHFATRSMYYLDFYVSNPIDLNKRINPHVNCE